MIRLISPPLNLSPFSSSQSSASSQASQSSRTNQPCVLSHFIFLVRLPVPTSPNHLSLWSFFISQTSKLDGQLTPAEEAEHWEKFSASSKTFFLSDHLCRATIRLSCVKMHKRSTQTHRCVRTTADTTQPEKIRPFCCGGI